MNFIIIDKKTEKIQAWIISKSDATLGYSELLVGSLIGKYWQNWIRQYTMGPKCFGNPRYLSFYDYTF